MRAITNNPKKLDPTKQFAVDDNIKARHDFSTTSETIRQLLADGTPNWVKHPEEYKQFARECFLAEKEISDEMASRYAMEDQEDLTNRAARMVNPMHTDEFIRRLRNFGIKCFTVYNGALAPEGHWLRQTVALWCLPPKQYQKARYVCYLRIPAMYEWSVLSLDAHKLPSGELRGWRTAITELIKKEILTEWQAHQIFGYPSSNPVFSRYHRTLWELRNGVLYDDTLGEKDV